MSTICPELTASICGGFCVLFVDRGYENWRQTEKQYLEMSVIVRSTNGLKLTVIACPYSSQLWAGWYPLPTPTLFEQW